VSGLLGAQPRRVVIFLGIFLNFCIGLIFVLCARDRIRVDGPFPMPPFFLVLMFVGAIELPLAIYLYWIHPAWSWLYIVDPTGVPDMVLLLIILVQCGAVIGLQAQDEEWLKGTRYAGVWYETPEDAAAHQAAMHVVPHGNFQAMAVSPLSTGRLDPPDICLIYGTPGQMIILINGLQWSGYGKFDWSVVGESSCADSWGRALSTGEPSLSIPCFAERRYGGVLDEELLMALPPRFLPKAIDGMRHLSNNGLRYPIPQYGIQSDARAGLGFSYQ